MEDVIPLDVWSGLLTKTGADGDPRLSNSSKKKSQAKVLYTTREICELKIEKEKSVHIMI